MKFVDVKNDIAFRKIFGNENRKETLISFLNAILDFHGDQRITKVTILNPYQLPKLKGGKVTIIDVKATDQAGRIYIVEMQVADIDGFDKRVLYYSSKSYSDLRLSYVVRPLLNEAGHLHQYFPAHIKKKPLVIMQNIVTSSFFIYQTIAQ